MSTSNQIMLMIVDPLTSVVPRIEARLGIKFTNDPEWNGHIYRFDGSCFHIDVMDEHEFVNDREILFESYPIAVRVAVAEQRRYSELRTGLEDAMALYMGNVLSDEFRCQVLVVKNLQRIIRRFAP